MKKNIIITIISVLILLVIVLIIKLINTPERQLERLLKSQDFTNYNNSYLYTKQISTNNIKTHNQNVQNNIESEYTVLYFNIKNYQLTKDTIYYSDGILKNLTPTYDYTNNTLTYNYRIYYNNINIIFKGIYDINTKKFTCEPTYSYQINTENSKETICNKVKAEIENFSYETRTFIEDYSLLQYMNKNNNK